MFPSWYWSEALLALSLMASSMYLRAFSCFPRLYVASANKWKVYDTPRAWRVLGFMPTGNAEAFRPH